MIVFLSHASRDYSLTGVLTITLRALGHPVQFSQQTPDERVKWSDVFEKIKASDAFVFAITPRSLASSSCKLEYSYARALNKLIVMVLMDDIDFNAVPPEIYVIPYIDCRKLGDESFHAVEDALEASLQISPPSETAAAYPDLTPIIAGLRKQVSNPPPDLRSQLALIDDLKELTKREETSVDARAILKQLKTRNGLLPEVAQTFKNTSNSLPRPETSGRIVILQIGLAAVILLIIGALAVVILSREQPLVINVTPIRVSTLSTGTVIVQNDAPTQALISQATDTNVPMTTNVLASATPDAPNTQSVIVAQTGTNVPTDTPPETEVLTSTTPNAQDTQSAINTQNIVSTETIAATFTQTLSPTPQTTATLGQTSVPTSTATLTVTATPSPLPTNTSTPTVTPTPTNTPTFTPTPTRTQSPTPTPTFLPLVYTGVIVEDTAEGVRINRLSDSITATGVQVGDYVLAVDVESVNTRDEFLAALENRPPFSYVTLRLRRDTQELFIRIALNALDFAAATSVPS